MRKVFPSFSIVTLFVIFVLSCSKEETPIDPIVDNEEPAVPSFYQVPDNPQIYGDALAGWDFLRYGNYVGSGAPLELYKQFFGVDGENHLEREGINADIAAAFTSFKIEGVDFIGGNCFTCHSSSIDGQFYPGMGNAFSDFTANQSVAFNVLEALVKNSYGENSAEYVFSKDLIDGTKAIGPYIVTDFKGVNPAFDIERAAVAHLNYDFSWNEEEQYDLPSRSIGSDVPAWWLLKKKNALYYNGMGRGDFTKSLMQTSVLGIRDSNFAREILHNFDDVLAFLNELEAPKYTGEINWEKAAVGETIFSKNCQTCHGTYGEGGSYPNYVIDLETIGTDPEYAKRLLNDDLNNWYNNSWFGTTAPDAEMDPYGGYIAPPLDGIWATAPYLHNGSVPNLYTLLNSEARPTYWERDFQDDTYDHDLIGWPYEERTVADNKNTYDTTLEGYANTGHTFGDQLTDEERVSVIEYLKTL